MSSDNFYLIWKKDGKYGVQMEFMSDDGPYEHRATAVLFDTLEAAVSHASSEYSEYGVYFDESARESNES